MYEDYFKLSGAPFKLNPDPKFFFGSRSHNKAMAYLHYGLKQAEGFIVITGPIGSGKTMVISQLLDQLSASNVIAAQLLTSNIAPEELLDHVLSAFRIEPEGEGRTGKLEAFEDYLFDQLNRGRRVLLIMDEAQNLPFETLEELRMLSNLDYDGTPLFQVFLVGQPEFRDIMQSERLEQLRQRVIASYHIENLSVEETREYIHHRLAIAGWREDPTFTDEAITSIFKETGGRPRRINTVCNRIMLYCSLENKHEVTAQIADTVIKELHEEELDARDTPAAEKAAGKRTPKRKMPEVKPVDKPAKTKAAVENDKEIDAPTPAEEVAEDETNGEREMSAETSVSEAPAPAESDDEERDTEPTSDGGDIESEYEDATAADTDEKTEVKEETVAEADDAAPTNDAETDQAEVKKTAKSASGGSVFDRVRAAKRPASASDAASEATLEDVASAIAKANAGELTDEFAADDEDDIGPAGAIAPLKPNQSSEWRQQVRHSIDETRGELKDAHASVRRLKKSLADLQRRRSDARSQIAASLKRAESLLREVGKRWS